MEPLAKNLQILPPEEAAKQPRIRINMVFLGSHFSHHFVNSLVNTITWTRNTNIDLFIHNAQASNVYQGRETLLGGDLNGGPDQKPFKGVPYNYIWFVDSDQVWTPNDLHLLLTANKDVISGAIKMADGNYAEGWYDPEKFRKQGFTYRLIDDVITNVDEPFRVSLIGCGFTLMKAGIVEKLQFPWFYPAKFLPPRAGYLGEDLSFFTRIKELGHELWLHPKCRIGHVKEVIL